MPWWGSKALPDTSFFSMKKNRWYAHRDSTSSVLALPAWPDTPSTISIIERENLVVSWCFQTPECGCLEEWTTLHSSSRTRQERGWRRREEGEWIQQGTLVLNCNSCQRLAQSSLQQMWAVQGNCGRECHKKDWPSHSSTCVAHTQQKWEGQPTALTSATGLSPTNQLD